MNLASVFLPHNSWVGMVPDCLKVSHRSHQNMENFGFRKFVKSAWFRLQLLFQSLGNRGDRCGVQGFSQQGLQWTCKGLEQHMQLYRKCKYISSCDSDCFMLHCFLPLASDTCSLLWKDKSNLCLAKWKSNTILHLNLNVPLKFHPVAVRSTWLTDRRRALHISVATKGSCSMLPPTSLVGAAGVYSLLCINKISKIRSFLLGETTSWYNLISQIHEIHEIQYSWYMQYHI